MKQPHSAHERLISCSQMKPEPIFKSLGASEYGLSAEQADRQREVFGENRILTQEKDTVLLRLRRSFINPFAVVLLILAAISFFTDVLLASDFGRNISTVVIILTMLLISGLVRFVQEMRSRKITSNLVRLVDSTVQVLRDGSWISLPAEELVVGDIVRLDAGDRVPADIRLLRTIDFFVTESLITGESGQQEKTAEPLMETPASINDYRNTVFLGSTVTGGIGRGIVVAVGEDTFYGGISPDHENHMDGYDKGEKSIAWVLIRFMLVLIPIIFIAYGLTRYSWTDAFLFALSAAVALMPEMTPMVITACLARGSSLMSQKQTVVKNINAMQVFGSMDILCVDKTGTLTEETVLLEYYMDILGNESAEVLDYAYLNSFYHTGIFNLLDSAVLRAKEMPGREEHFDELTKRYEKIDEIPFDYSRRFATILLRSEDRQFMVAKGSIREVVDRCSYVSYRGEVQKIDSDRAANVYAIVDEMLDDGMKVLAVAVRETDSSSISTEDEHDMTLMGYLAFFDTPKQSAAGAIEKLHDLHIQVRVLSGDHVDVTESVCRRLGIPADAILTGSVMDTLSEEELAEAIEDTPVFAELSPRQKDIIVEHLQDNGHTVGFLGDGMNDLPATLQADVGISVENAADTLKDSAQVIMLKKDLTSLAEGVLEGRKAFVNMSKYIRITATSSLGSICAIVAASVLLPFFPMTAMQILLLDLLYNILCLVLPWDNVDRDMYEKPMEWSGRTLSRFMLSFAPVNLLFDFINFAFMYFVLCPVLCGGGFAVLDGAAQAVFISIFQTGWFLESMWTQILLLYLLRTKHIPFVQSRPSGTMLFVTLFGFTAFTLLTVTPLGALFGLHALPPVYFVFLSASVILYLLTMTCVKKRYIKKYGDLF